MIDPVQITEEEQTLLKQHYRKAASELIRQHAHAILLFSDGFSCYETFI